MSKKFELKGNTVMFNNEECVPALLVNVDDDRSIVVASDTYYNFNNMTDEELKSIIGVVCIPKVYHILPLTGDITEETICKLNSCYRMSKESEAINTYFFGDDSDFNIDYPELDDLSDDEDYDLDDFDDTDMYEDNFDGE